METKHKTGLTVFFLILAIILIGICAGYVIAVNAFSVAELADSAANNSDFFWNQFSVGDRVNDDTGVESRPNWICFSERKNTGVGSGNNVKCIIDINRYQNGTYTTSIYGQSGVSNHANDTNVKKLAYLCYAATYYSDTGYVSSNENGPRNAMYYFFNSTNLEYLIGNFSKKRGSTDWSSSALKFGQTILNYANTYATSETTGSSATITGNPSHPARPVSPSPAPVSESAAETAAADSEKRRSAEAGPDFPQSGSPACRCPAVPQEISAGCSALPASRFPHDPECRFFFRCLPALSC